MDQLVSFKVGAALANDPSGNYYYNASDPPPTINNGGYGNDFTLVRSIRVTMMARTPPNGTLPYRNRFDGGPYQVLGVVGGRKPQEHVDEGPMRCDMKNQLSRTCSFPKHPGVAMTPRRGQGTIHNRGVALIITLLLLFLLSVIGLAAVVSSSSDLMINGYYKNYRGSFYAADSGLNMGREAIYTYFNTPTNSPSTWPTAQSVATSAGDHLATSAGPYVTDLYGNSTSLNTGTAASSVPASFKIITATVTLPSGPSPTGSPVHQLAVRLQLHLESQGTSQGSETAQIIETGAITVNITQGSGTSTTNASFAAFGAFIDSFTACQGPLVQGYLTGPMYAMRTMELIDRQQPGLHLYRSCFPDGFQVQLL